MPVLAPTMEDHRRMVRYEDDPSLCRFITMARSRHEVLEKFHEEPTEFSSFALLVMKQPGWAASYLMELPYPELAQFRDDCDAFEWEPSSFSRLPLLRAADFVEHWADLAAAFIPEEVDNFWGELDYQLIRVAGITPVASFIDKLIDTNTAASRLVGNPHITDEQLVRLTYVARSGFFINSKRFMEALSPKMSFHVLVSLGLVEDLLEDEPPFDAETFEVLSQNWVGSLEDLLTAVRAFS